MILIILVALVVFIHESSAFAYSSNFNEDSYSDSDVFSPHERPVCFGLFQ